MSERGNEYEEYPSRFNGEPIDAEPYSLSGWPPPDKKQKEEFRRQYELCLRQGRKYQATGSLSAFRTKPREKKDAAEVV